MIDFFLWSSRRVEKVWIEGPMSISMTSRFLKILSYATYIYGRADSFQPIRSE